MKVLPPTIIVVLLIATIGLSRSMFAQDRPADPPKVEKSTAPKMSLERKEKFEALQKKSLEVYIKMQQIQKRYDDARDSNPEYANLVKENKEVSEKLNTLSAEAMKDVDETKWQLNYDTLDYDPVSQPTPSAPKKP